MAIEIERKFLVIDDSWRNDVQSSENLRQAYLAADGRVTVRVRTGDAGRAWLTLKGGGNAISQLEFEYSVPYEDARDIMTKLSDTNVVEKIRHTIVYAGNEWVVDEFHGDNLGLFVAEIELDDEAQAFEKPAWLGAEVTSDRRYRNKALSRTPYLDW